MYWLTPGLRYDPNVKKKEVDVKASA